MTNEVLKVAGVSKAFGQFLALENVSLSVMSSERRAIIGPNGAGKSTLFNIIAGQMAPTGGQILINGVDVTGARPDEVWGQGVTRTFQRNQLFQGLRVWENVELACAGRYQNWTSIFGIPRGRQTETDIGDILAKRLIFSPAPTAWCETLPMANNGSLNLHLRWRVRPKSCCSMNRPRGCLRPRLNRCWR